MKQKKTFLVLFLFLLTMLSLTACGKEGKLDEGDSKCNVYFTDMQNHWANIYVNTAKNYLAAYTDGTFKPDQAAVREDVTVSLVKLKGYDINSVNYSYLSQFTDTNSISI